MFTAIKSAFTSQGLDKPKFKEVAKHDEYEERHYESCYWVSTVVKSMTHKDATSKGFWRLFNYISGENEGKTKVEMTAPVTVQVVPGAGPNCESTFTISFYVPPEHQADPPKPSSKEVFLNKFKEMSVYVRTFGGFAKDDDWVTKGRELAEEMEKKGEASNFNQDYYFTAGYDSPFKLFGRHNEVWFVKNEGQEIS